MIEPLEGLYERGTPAEAVRLGLDTRIGFEDILVLPDGSPAPDNAAPVVAARDLIAAAIVK